MSTVFVISAPSGAGKSTLIKRLLAREGGLRYAISVTTRVRRDSEVDGEAYQFVSEKRFVEMRDAGELLEWAKVFGHYYGTPRSVVEEAQRLGLDLVVDIDVQGAAQLKKRLVKAVKIFILPPSKEILVQRLTDRSSDSRSVIRRRLDEASREVGRYTDYDYVVVNDDLERSTETLQAILLAERSRRKRMEEVIGPVLDSFCVGPHNTRKGA